MTTILLPFHQDEPVAPGSIVLPADLSGAVVAPDISGDSQWDRLGLLYNTMADVVANSLTGDESTTVVTGDCLALLGTLAGAQRAGLDPSVVWFDAHGDVHTMASSVSGYLGGMALRMAVGGDADLLANRLGLRAVPESRAVLVDARDLDPAEAEYLAQSAITHVTVEDADVGLLPEGPVILHVDLDVIDAGEIPGLRFPATGGPNSTSVIEALRRLLHSGQVAVFDVACPWFDPIDQAQADRRAGLLARVLDLRTSR